MGFFINVPKFQLFSLSAPLWIAKTLLLFKLIIGHPEAPGSVEHKCSISHKFISIFWIIPFEYKAFNPLE